MADIWDNAHKAIDLLKHQKVLPAVDSFAVFYSYICKNNHALATDFDEYLQNNGNISSSFCETLYKKYLESIDSDKILNTGDMLAEEMRNVLNDINKIGKTTHSFNNRLSDAKSNLEGITNLNEIKVVIEGLSNATVDMASNSIEMETKLNNTTKEIEILRQELEEVKNEAYKDALTGLANRKSLNSFLDENIARFNKDGVIISGIMADIDDFKRINDTWGHLTGDQVIKFVASVMQDEAPENSIVCRYGGEEFIIILPALTIEKAKEIAEKIRRTVMHKKLIRRNSGKSLGGVTISIGVSKYLKGETATEFIDRCDAALYVSKHNGKNRITTALSPNAFQS